MGAIAEIYKKMGGEVIIKGKPDISIYVKSTESLGIDKTRTIAIGDSLFHDIKGANNMNYDSMIIANGIHKKEIEKEGIEKISKNYNVIVNFIQNELKW